MKLFCNACKTVFQAVPQEGVAETPCPGCGQNTAVPEKRVAPGIVIGDFLIEKNLSQGGMGEVFVARQLSLDRQVALKVLQERFTNDSEYVEGLFREARAAAKITHPHIVQAYAVGEEDGVYYFAMELIRGETFKQILKRENVLDFTKAAKVIREIASALDVAWKEQKLVHQDIKPDNIMLDSNGFSKLADLGLARSASGSENENSDADEVLGTPQYISPEQLTGVATDVRSDIYSLGATFFQFVTGRFPYVADTAEEIARMHVEGNLIPPKEFNSDLPDALNDIIVKMMARDITQRYQLPSELITDLDAFLNAPVQTGKPALKRPGLSAPGGLKKPGMPTLTKPGLSAAKPGLSAAKPGLSATKPAISSLGKPAAKPGMPTLAKPGLSAAKPGLSAAKPGSAGTKPAVPGLSKAAVKPVVPGSGKPENTSPEEEVKTPAEETPAVPQNETPQAAVPVAEPVPAAESVPVAESEPAAQPAQDAPEKKEDDGITLAPETRRRKKTEEQAEGEAGQSENAQENSKKKADDKKKKKLPKYLVIILFSLLGLLIVAGLAGGFFFAAKKDKLPAKIKPWGEKLLAFAGQKAEADAEKKEEPAPAPEVPAAPVKVVPKEPEKPKTRPEYLAALESLRNEFRSTPSSQKGKLLDKADETFQKLGLHQTPEELAVLIRTWALYSTTDENERFKKPREAAQAKYEKESAARQAARQKELQHQQQQKEDEERRKQELAQHNADFAKDQQVRQADIDRRYARLKRELDNLNINLIKAVISSAESGDDTAYKTAIAEAKNYIVPVLCDTIRERAAIKNFESFKNTSGAALAAYKKFLSESRKISARGMMMIPLLGQKTLVRLTGLTPDGKIAYRAPQQGTGIYVPQNAAEKSAVAAYLIKHTRLEHGAFYYYLLTRNFTPEILKFPRSAFWTLALKEYQSRLKK